MKAAKQPNKIKKKDTSIIDKIITEARIDYALGNYKTFSKAKDLITKL